MARSAIASVRSQRSLSAALLLLRVVAAGSLLLKHGLEKVAHFSAMASHFPDPVHLGRTPSLAIALISDFVCSILIVLGLLTRSAALFAFFNLAVAWAFVHYFQFFGRTGDHGELIVLYLAALGALVLAGPGEYSLDRLIASRRRASRSAQH